MPCRVHRWTASPKEVALCPLSAPRTKFFKDRSAIAFVYACCKKLTHACCNLQCNLLITAPLGNCKKLTSQTNCHKRFRNCLLIQESDVLSSQVYQCNEGHQTGETHEKILFMQSAVNCNLRSRLHIIVCRTSFFISGESYIFSCLFIFSGCFHSFLTLPLLNQLTILYFFQRGGLGTLLSDISLNYCTKPCTNRSFQSIVLVKFCFQLFQVLYGLL